MNKDPMFNCPWLMNDPRNITTKQYIKIVDLSENVSATAGRCCPKSQSPK